MKMNARIKHLILGWVNIYIIDQRYKMSRVGILQYNKYKYHCCQYWTVLRTQKKCIFVLAVKYLIWNCFNIAMIPLSFHWWTWCVCLCAGVCEHPEAVDAGGGLAAVPTHHPRLRLLRHQVRHTSLWGTSFVLQHQVCRTSLWGTSLWWGGSYTCHLKQTVHCLPVLPNNGRLWAVWYYNECLLFLFMLSFIVQQ